MRYLVFGSAGFVGKNLVDHLQTRGEEVVAVNRRNGQYNVDISRMETFACLKKINADIIINCASVLPGKSIPGIDYLKALFDANVIGSANIMNYAAQQNMQRVMNCSSLSVVNKPWPVPLKESFEAYPSGIHAGYCASKLSQEIVMNQMASLSGIQLIHLRLSSLYGAGMKWEGILSDLIDKAIRNEKILLYNSEKISFDFLYINDLIKIISSLSALPQWNAKAVNVASGKEVYLNEMAEKIIFYTGSSASIETINNDQLPSRSVIDISLLQQMTGNFDTASIETELPRLISYALKQIECAI